MAVPLRPDVRCKRSIGSEGLTADLAVVAKAFVFDRRVALVFIFLKVITKDPQYVCT